MINGLGVDVYTPQWLREDGKSFWRALRGKLGDVSDGDLRDMLEMMSTSGRRMVISEENILGGMSRPDGHANPELYVSAYENVKGVIERTKEYPFHLSLAIRNPATFLTSAYLHGLARGRMMTFDDYLNGVRPTDYLWSDLIEQLLTIDNVERFVVWRYEDYARLQQKIFRTVVKWRVGKLVEPLDPGVNASLSAEAYQELCRIGLDQATKADVVRLKEKFPSGIEHPKYRPFSDEYLAKVQAHYDKDVERIRSIKGVNFLR